MRRCPGRSLQRLHDVEAVHVRHHQVEHDQIRPLLARGLDRLAAAVGAQHRAAEAQDANGDQLDRLGIVVDDQDLERPPLGERKQAELDAATRTAPAGRSAFA